MKFRILATSVVCVVFTIGFVLSVFAQGLKPIQLPEPKLDPSKSLVQALKDRQTSREYAGDKLPEQMLSNLLWAAWGINRPDTGKRTAPSAVNWQETDVYVSTTMGMYLYDPKGNVLVPVLPGDNRALTYTQVERFKDAPLNLVYVADFQKMGDADEARKIMLASMDTGFIAENVYLYCASENLPTCFRVSIDKEKLGQALKLRPTQRIMGAQSVGLPKGK
jgi:hypothetical protein